MSKFDNANSAKIKELSQPRSTFTQRDHLGCTEGRHGVPGAHKESMYTYIQLPKASR
jgi:hypothetical protein